MSLYGRLRAYRDRSEARPDTFTRYELPVLLDASRAAVARLLHAPAEAVVLVSKRTKNGTKDVDARAAGESIYGGLIASGWMTASIMMRLLVDHYVSRMASMGSPGLDELRWLRPVRAGDVLGVRLTEDDSVDV